MIINAYIDESNLFLSLKEIGVKIDYFKFYIFLKEKYKVDKAYIFLGYTRKNDYIYTKIIKAGFTIVYKELGEDKTENIKGNCDCEIVLNIVKDFFNHKYQKAILVSSDGDFACVVSFLNSNQALERVISPRSDNCSIFLKRAANKITFLDECSELVFYKEKAPDRDETL